MLGFCFKFVYLQKDNKHLNLKDCLHAYMDEGQYHITFPDGTEPQTGKLQNLKWDEDTSVCTTQGKQGKLAFRFDIQDNSIKSFSVEMDIKQVPNEGYWEMPTITVKISPVNSNLFPKDQFVIKRNDIYAGQRFSYSCKSFVLQNSVSPKENEPSIRLTLNRFQVQPFKEERDHVFAESFDCSVWLTMPTIMGLILVLFIIFTTMAGVYLLMEQGNQISDLKFSKQGGMLMNQAQLDATKG